MLKLFYLHVYWQYIIASYTRNRLPSKYSFWMITCSRKQNKTEWPKLSWKDALEERRCRTTNVSNPSFICKRQHAHLKHWRIKRGEWIWCRKPAIIPTSKLHVKRLSKFHLRDETVESFYANSASLPCPNRPRLINLK